MAKYRNPSDRNNKNTELTFEPHEEIAPLCPHFGECGGCSYQNIPYDIQISAKRNQLSSIVSSPLSVELFSASPFHYRNRMDFIFTKEGLGLKSRGTWKNCVTIDSCPIASNQLNDILKEIQLFFKDADVFNEKSKLGTLKYAVIRTPKGGAAVSFVVIKQSPGILAVTEQIKEFANKTSVPNIYITFVHRDSGVSVSDDMKVIKGSEFLTEYFESKEMNRQEYRFSPQGFFQNNTEMATKLVGYAKKLLANYDSKNSFLLDLYGGVGTFGVALANDFREVLTVELDKGCADAARENILANQLTNMQSKWIDAKMLSKLSLGTPLIVLTDPPRSGMHPMTIATLRKLSPNIILYVSCNPSQLAIDLPALVEYEVASLAVFDLFPQTPHSEAVVLLKRK